MNHVTTANRGFEKSYMIIFFFAIIILEINQYISPDIMKEALMKL